MDGAEVEAHSVDSEGTEVVCVAYADDVMVVEEGMAAVVV